MKPEPYWTSRDGRHCLYLGDCLDVLPGMEPGSVDAVVTDPPFAEETHKGARTLAGGAGGRELITFDSMTAEEVVAVCRQLVEVSSSWVVATVDWRHMAILDSAGLLVRFGVWNKPDGAPQLSGDRPSMGWEAVAIMHKPGRKRWNGGGSRAVWTHNRSREGWHEAEKPVSLIEEILHLFTAFNARVLDPYCGSGTTGVACIRTGRRFVGVEIEKRYADIAVRRMERELSQPHLPGLAPHEAGDVARGLFGE